MRPLAGQKVDLKIERGSQELRVPIEVSKVHLKNAYGEDEETGGIKGMTPNPSEPVVGISDPNSVAYIAGLRTGDTITKIENKPILVFEDIADTLSSLWVDNKPIMISYKRKPNLEIKEVPEQTVSLNLPKQSKVVSLFGVGTLLGIYPSELFVRQLSAGSPAEKGGPKVGDRIEKLPKGFVALGCTENSPNAVIGDLKRNIYGLQFHPEVAHTQKGKEILQNFLFEI